MKVDKKHDRTWFKEDTRSWEIPRPGRNKQLYLRELKRKQDRQQIAFFCKYVMADKDIRIPLK